MLKFSFPDPAIICATTYKISDEAGTTTSTALLANIAKTPSFPALPQISEIAQHPVIFMNQTHGSNCAIITQQTTTTVLDTDAVLTTLPNLTLAVKTADCLPILLWHPSGIVGALHAGRQGTNQKILKKTLRLLKTQFGISAGIHLIFGPAICTDCYTVCLNPEKHFDLVKENYTQAAAIFSQEHITIHHSRRCTAHEAEFFHSYRRDGKGVPMNYSIICRNQ